MKTVEQKQKELDALTDKVRALRKEIENDAKEKYKHLIGRCFKSESGNYFLITDIVSEYDGDIHVKGIGLHSNYVPIRFDAFSFITEADLKELEIPREEFSKEFDKVVEQIKKDIGI